MQCTFDLLYNLKYINKYVIKPSFVVELIEYSRGIQKFKCFCLIPMTYL